MRHTFIYITTTLCTTLLQLPLPLHPYIFTNATTSTPPLLPLLPGIRELFSGQEHKDLGC